MNLREQRKWDHLKHSLEIPGGPQTTGFANVKLVHQALSFLDLEEIDLTTSLFGKQLKFPLIINAMTGGAPGLEKINYNLALAARECNIGIAVGSQTAALKNPDLRYTFDIVRKTNPKGLVLANISALANLDEARQAVEMIEADGLQLHLNIAQELAMQEGDRHFAKTLENMINLQSQINVPVIIKEVGFGMSQETVRELSKIGINVIDIGGSGGTNFAAIENARKNNSINQELINWGIPTAISLVETMHICKPFEQYKIIASGGINSPLDILKSLAIGAWSVGIALPVLKKTYRQSPDNLINYLDSLIQQTKEYMLLIGAKDLQEVRKCPVIFTGEVKEWLELRGVKLSEYAQRNN